MCAEPNAAAGVEHPAPIRTRTVQQEPGRERHYPPRPEPLPSPIYDNHTHLDIVDGEHALSPAAQLDWAAEVGVRGIVQVGVDLATSRWSAELAARDPRVLAAVALHPNEAPLVAERGELDEQLAEIARLATLPRVRAIGETGLDYFRTGPDGRAAQQYSFEEHIRIANSAGIALQIHDRDAHADVVATLLRVGAPERTVFHCFSGDEELAALCAQHGWYLSFSGTLTFKNAANLRAAARIAPAELLLLETDAPFLTPTPHRGKPNSTYLLPHTLRVQAELRDADVERLAELVARNTETVYGSWADS